MNWRSASAQSNSSLPQDARQNAVKPVRKARYSTAPSEVPFVFDLSRFTRDERDELKAVLIAFRDGHATKADHVSLGRFMAMSRGSS